MGETAEANPTYRILRGVEAINAPEIDDSIIEKIKDISNNRSLKDIILEELKKLYTVKILETAGFPTRYADIHTISHIVIDFEYSTEETCILFGLIKRRKEVPLTSLSEISKKLAENKEIGQATKQEKHYLVYDKPLGVSKFQVPYEKEKRLFAVFDRVLIKDRTFE